MTETSSQDVAMTGGDEPAGRTRSAEGALTTQQVKQMIEESRAATVTELRELVKQDWDNSGTAKRMVAMEARQVHVDKEVGGLKGMLEALCLKMGVPTAPTEPQGTQETPKAEDIPVEAEVAAAAAMSESAKRPAAIEAKEEEERKVRSRATPAGDDGSGDHR